MTRTAALCGRHPDRELAIRRRYRTDRAFRAVCDDFEEAAGALDRFRGEGSSGSERADEYRQLAAELEAEILAMLGDAAPGGRQAL
ncbi:MAG: hypothetical protein U1E40_12205 [Amaricoccus sp.]